MSKFEKDSKYQSMEEIVLKMKEKDFENLNFVTEFEMGSSTAMH